MEVSREELYKTVPSFIKGETTGKKRGDRYNFLLLQPITQATLCQIVEKVG